jgi:nucleotide-binding universal stress UspA family protein
MFELIVVALDGSEHSLKALDYARELAEKTRFKTHFIACLSFHFRSSRV